MFPTSDRMRLRAAWLAPVVVLGLAPSRALPEDLVFSGRLERVRHESISVRLPNRILIEARLPNTADFAAPTLVAQYNIGDHVRIACKPISRVWEEEAFRMQYLELEKLENLGPPSPEELSRIYEEHPWRRLNLLKRSAAAAAAIAAGTAKLNAASQSTPELERVRKINLDFAANLPEFTADETAKRFTSRATAADWKPFDAIQSEVAFKGNTAVRTHILRDGKPWPQIFYALPGFLWTGGVGIELKPLFDPGCFASIALEGPQQVRGKQLMAYRFSALADACFGSFDYEYRRYVPARTGRILLDDPGGNVIQYEEEAIEFPKEFDFAYRKENVSWDFVKIGGTSYLLPVAAEFEAFYSAGNRWRVVMEYKNHRHM